MVQMGDPWDLTNMALTASWVLTAIWQDLVTVSMVQMDKQFVEQDPMQEEAQVGGLVILMMALGVLALMDNSLDLVTADPMALVLIPVHLVQVADMGNQDQGMIALAPMAFP